MSRGKVAGLMAGHGPLMRTSEVAGLLGCSSSHVRALCQHGELPCARIGGRWLVRTAELFELLGFREAHEEMD